MELGPNDYAVLRRALRAELDELRSIRKNGDTWWQWTKRQTTPERVLLGAVVAFQAIFTIGGRVQLYETSLQETTRELAGVRSDIVAAGDQVQKQIDALRDGQGSIALRVDRVEMSAKKLEEQSALIVTRGEFRRTINEQLVPRLERMERQLTR